MVGETMNEQISLSRRQKRKSLRNAVYYSSVADPVQKQEKGKNVNFAWIK